MAKSPPYPENATYTLLASVAAELTLLKAELRQMRAEHLQVKQTMNQILVLDDARLYNAPQVAAILGVTLQTVQRKFRKGELKSVNDGKNYETSGKILKAYLAGKKNKNAKMVFFER